MLPKRIILKLFLALLFVMQLCAAQAASLDDLYDQAVSDAKVVEAGEISRNLVGISSPDEKNVPAVLSWKVISGSQHVLVCTWAGNRIKSKNWQVGSTYSLGATDNLWITAVPELKNFFHDKGFWPSTQADKVLRIEQLLGLPKDSNQAVFIEFWVKPADIFRPSPDSDPSDHEAQLVYPWKNTRFQNFDSTKKIHEYVDAGNPNVVYNYKQWYENLNSTTYVGNPPYPWTQLGYTYDWADDKYNNDHVGLSEFIVLGGSSIVIEKVMNTEELDNYFVKP